MTGTTNIITTLQNDANAAETFLEAEGQKIFAALTAAAAPAEQAVVKAFNTLVADAKLEVQTLVPAAEKATADNLAEFADTLETALANLVQKVVNGNVGQAVTTTLGASGIQQLGTEAAALIGPLLVKVIAAVI